MSTPERFDNATAAWQHQLRYILDNGREVSPRGKPTLEVRHPSLRINMNRPAVRVEERGLSYSFMAAEALWMIRGDDTVSGIAPWNSNIEKFSDDGETFFGAYGPKIVGQSDYVVDALLEDRHTRQAVLTIWRENPPESKDIPCTVSMDFQIREHLGRDDLDQLNCHVYMRSSDIWLGLPYDVFNFSMVSAWIASRFNERLGESDKLVVPGDLFWTAGSSHLYEDPGWIDFEMSDAEECAEATNLENDDSWDTPPFPIDFTLRGMGGWRKIRSCLLDARQNVDRQYERRFTPRPKRHRAAPNERS